MYEVKAGAWRRHGAFELRQLGTEFLEIATVALAHYRVRQPELYYPRALIPAPIVCNALEAIDFGLRSYLAHLHVGERDQESLDGARILGLALASGLTQRCALSEEHVSALKSASFVSATKEFRYGVSKLIEADSILDATRALFRGLEGLEMKPSLPIRRKLHRRKWLHPITARRRW
jgi:hypothetical protein